MTERRCTGAILAGGQSSRMGGTAKGLAVVNGARIIDRVAHALREATDSLIVVANDAAATVWIPSVPIVCDARPGLGALSGIHAAMRASGTDLLVLRGMPRLFPARCCARCAMPGNSRAQGWRRR